MSDAREDFKKLGVSPSPAAHTSRVVVGHVVRLPWLRVKARQAVRYLSRYPVPVLRLVVRGATASLSVNVKNTTRRYTH
jgi:hypothetical protein